jgi:hypothetical protein
MEQEKMATALIEVFNIVSKDNKNDSAKIFGVDLNDSTTAKEIGRGPDIYDLIEDINLDKKQSGYDFVALLTTGWAAPLGNDGKMEGTPSEHKDRRRVTLMTLLDIKEKDLASVLKFDDEDEPILDFNSATGSLQTAIMWLAEQE